MALVSEPLYISKNWLVVESDVPFYIAFNATAPNALENGKIKADDYIKSRGGSRYFSCTDLLSTSMKVCGYNIWLVWDSDNVTENIKAPTYYTCYTKPDTLQGLDGQIVEIGGVQNPIPTLDGTFRIEDLETTLDSGYYLIKSGSKFEIDITSSPTVASYKLCAITDIFVKYRFNGNELKATVFSGEYVLYFGGKYNDSYLSYYKDFCAYMKKTSDGTVISNPDSDMSLFCNGYIDITFDLRVTPSNKSVKIFGAYKDLG